jgi:hypothetical protein
MARALEMTKVIRGLYEQEFVKPGIIRVSAEALQLARDFAFTAGRRYVTAFDWAQDITRRAKGSATATQIGPCMMLGGFERVDVPIEFLQKVDGFDYAISIPEPIWQASTERLIVVDEGQPFQLALR